ncbi:MAG TPA: hypothetical protein VFR03_18195 [Thermoanaerobaculia bacterium]|nr:hypothetical protein [Thermoanaerobaculia bacterium]
MAFKAEELTSKIFPESGAGIWAACPQDTLGKGERPPCPENTKRQGPQGPGGGQPRPPQEPRRPPKKAEGPDRDALVLLQGQLRDRLARGPAAAGL